MFLVGLISWWYGRGWAGQWQRAMQQLTGTLEFFSVGQLMATLFAPYRQISANGASNGTFGDSFRAFVDKLISRIIGAIVRSFTIIIGLVVIAVQTVYQTVVIAAWGFVPLLPVVGALLYAIGWVPSWM